MIDFTAEGLPDSVFLRPSVRSAARGMEAAGPEARRDEYRWRVRCDGPRCKAVLVFSGEKLAARVLDAFRAGRFREVGDGRLRGRVKADARIGVERGDVDSWKAAAEQGATRRPVLDLFVGEDL